MPPSAGSRPRPARPDDYDEIAAVADGRRTVSAVTAPVNTGSITFHQSMGFTVTGPVADYNGPGRDLVTFERPL